jgi:hypothetical protein
MSYDVLYSTTGNADVPQHQVVKRFHAAIAALISRSRALASRSSGGSSATSATAGAGKFAQSRLYFAQYRRWPELRNDSFGLIQMPDGGLPFSLGFVEQAEDHFTSADVMAVRIKSRVLAHLFQ